MNEQDQQEQAYQLHLQFMDWFNGDEIRGDFINACNILKDKIPQVIDLDLLEDAYYWQPKSKESYTIDDIDLPF